MKPKGIFIKAEFVRISQNDSAGMVNVTCDGDQSWVYSHIGTHTGMQFSENVDEAAAKAFGDELAALMRKHFPNPQPILESRASSRV